MSSLVTRRKQNDLLTLKCPDVLRLLMTLHIAQNFVSVIVGTWRSQWPRDLRHRSSAVRLMGLRVRISPGPWMSVCCECRVLSGRGLCVGLITLPGQSYRMWRVCVIMKPQK